MKSRKSNQLRIIGGQWRSRVLLVPDIEGLRPTPNRVRETLFNWLQGVITGARCLDLFAGSGALGIEALSRGAAEVILVEQNPLVAATLRTGLTQLGANHHGQVVQTDAIAYLQGPSRPFDLVFLDPPFHKDWVPRCCVLLQERGWLTTASRIYLETEAGFAVQSLPPTWELVRTRQAGQVGYHLARYTLPHAAQMTHPEVTMSKEKKAAENGQSLLTDIKTLRERARKHIEDGAVTAGYRAERETVIKLLNEALATEIVCILRYKRHFFMASGINADAVAQEFLQHATEEQTHADQIAARIVQLRGSPNFNPEGLTIRSHAEYVEGNTLVEMIREDLVAERIAIDSYGEMIRYLGDKDPTTRRMLETILAMEEEHADDLSSLLEELT